MNPYRENGYAPVRQQATWRRFIGPLVFAAFSVVSVGRAMGCSPAMPSPEQQLDVGLFQKEMLDCVSAFNTRQLIDACRADVRVKHNRVDAGHD